MKEVPQQRAVMSKEYWKLNREPGPVEPFQQKSCGLGLPLVAVVLQIGKAVLGDFSRGETRLFQRRLKKVLIWCRLFD